MRLSDAFGKKWLVQTIMEAKSVSLCWFALCRKCEVAKLLDFLEPSKDNALEVILNAVLVGYPFLLLISCIWMAHNIVWCGSAFKRNEQGANEARRARSSSRPLSLWNSTTI